MDLRVLSTAMYYKKICGAKVDVVLMTQDAGLRGRCDRNGVETISIRELVGWKGEDKLWDLVAGVDEDGGGGGNNIFERHLSKEAIEVLLSGSEDEAVVGGQVRQGRVRVNVCDGAGTVMIRGSDEKVSECHFYKRKPTNPHHARTRSYINTNNFVTIFCSVQVEITDDISLNRAFDGDVVAVREGKVVGIIRSNLKASYAGALVVGGGDDDDIKGKGNAIFQVSERSWVVLSVAAHTHARTHTHNTHTHTHTKTHTHTHTHILTLRFLLRSPFFLLGSRRILTSRG